MQKVAKAKFRPSRKLGELLLYLKKLEDCLAAWKQRNEGRLKTFAQYCRYALHFIWPVLTRFCHTNFLFYIFYILCYYINMTGIVLGGGRVWATAGNRPHVSLLMTFRKFERGSGDECGRNTFTPLKSPSVMSLIHVYQWMRSETWK